MRNKAYSPPPPSPHTHTPPFQPCQYCNSRNIFSLKRPTLYAWRPVTGIYVCLHVHSTQQHTYKHRTELSIFLCIHSLSSSQFQNHLECSLTNLVLTHVCTSCLHISAVVIDQLTSTCTLWQHASLSPCPLPQGVLLPGGLPPDSLDLGCGPSTLDHA